MSIKVSVNPGFKVHRPSNIMLSMSVWWIEVQEVATLCH